MAPRRDRGWHFGGACAERRGCVGGHGPGALARVGRASIELHRAMSQGRWLVVRACQETVNGGAEDDALCVADCPARVVVARLVGLAV